MSELEIIAVNEGRFANLMNVKIKVSEEYKKVLLDRLDLIAKLHPENLRYNYGRKVFAFIMPEFKVRFDINLNQMTAEISGQNLQVVPELKERFKN